MKYAPPPDLTSNNAKPSPAIQTFFPVQNVSAPPIILNPYDSEGSRSNNPGVLRQSASASSEQLSAPEQLSRNSSLHGSFRSSPVAAGTAYSSPATSATPNPFCESTYVPASSPSSSQFSSSSSLSRPIPPRVLEPATPQNTPVVNVSFLPAFVPYASPDLPRESASSPDKDVAACLRDQPNRLPNSQPDFSRDGAYEATAGGPARKPADTADVTFTPISAAKVTEKLEHLLAERQENSSSPCKTSREAATPEVDELTSGLAVEFTRSFESHEGESSLIPAANESVDKPYRVDGAQRKAVYPVADNVALSDVFLGQESPARSAIYPEEVVRLVDNGSYVTDVHAAKSSAHPPQQRHQSAQQSAPSAVPRADGLAEGNNKSSLNYVPTAVRQFSQQGGSFYDPAPTSQPAANVFLESNSPDRFPNFSAQRQQQRNEFAYGRSTVDPGTSSDPAHESSAFAAIWSAGRPSQPANAAAPSGVQSAYTTSQIRAPPAPTFYNPAEFANEPFKQPPTHPVHTYEQRYPQQHSYGQSPAVYESAGGPPPPPQQQQPYAACEHDAYPLSVVSMVTTTAPEPTGSATLSPVQMSANSLTSRATPDTVPPSLQNLVRIERNELIN